MTFHFILLILALASFLGAALDIKPARVSLMPLGLFFWLLATMIER